MTKSHHKHPIFFKFIFSSLTILFFGIYLISRGQKDKNDFIHKIGKVIYYENNYPEIERPNGKYKYLVIDSYNKIFELYVQEEMNENYVFNYNEIKTGDVIDIYFDENNYQSDKRTNTSMYSIDKRGVNLFYSNFNNKIAGFGFITFWFIIFVGLIFLKLKGKIE